MKKAESTNNEEGGRMKNIDDIRADVERIFGEPPAAGASVRNTLHQMEGAGVVVWWGLIPPAVLDATF